MRDIASAMAIISNEIKKLSEDDKATFDQIIMIGNGQMKDGFLGTYSDTDEFEHYNGTGSS